MHPGVVTAKLSSSNQQQIAVGVEETPLSSNFAFTRSTSLTSTSGANSMRLSAVRKRPGKQELNGPRSIPCTASLSFRKVRPLEKGLSFAP